MVASVRMASLFACKGLVAGLCGLASMLLPVGSTRAQESPPAAVEITATESPKDSAKEDAAAVIHTLRCSGDIVLAGDVLVATPADPSRANRVGDSEKTIAQARAEVQQLAQQLDQAKRRIAELERALARDPWRAGEAAQWKALAGEKGIWADKPPVSPGALPPAAPAPAPKGGSHAGRQQRLDALEQQIQALLKEVRSLRQETRTQTTPEQPPLTK